MATPLPPPLSYLETRLGLAAGTLTGTEAARATAALEDASALALAEAPQNVADTWALSAPAVVVLVVLKAARREVENPRGLETETVGDRSVGLTQTSGVYLTASEVAQVRRAARGGGRRRVGTLRTPSAYEGAP